MEVKYLMAQTKFNCKTCHRLIDKQQAICPFCGSANPHFSQSDNGSPKPETKKTASSSNTPAPEQSTEKVTQRRIPSVSIDEMESLLNCDVEDFTDGSNSDEEINKSVSGDFHNSQQVKNEPDEYEEEYFAESTDPESDDEAETEEETDAEERDEEINSSASSRRSKINWTDEKPKPEPDYSKMYDQKNNYNANFDGYYNDTLPKIADEIDSLLAGKEKAILKIVFSIAAIFAIIVYLILTL